MKTFNPKPIAVHWIPLIIVGIMVFAVSLICAFVL